MTEGHTRSGEMPGVKGLATIAAVALLAGACSQGAEGKVDVSRSTGGAGAQAAASTEATTYTTVKNAPPDPDPAADTGGLVVHPVGPLSIMDRPGGRVIATLPTRQLGSATWVPVVNRSGDWFQVLLPSRPNQSSGWISTRSGGLRKARTPYLIKVDVARRSVTLLRKARPVGRWRVAVGGPKTPTPAGRTFVLALLQPSKARAGELVLPLGTHSATLDTFGGGPGTVALHGWRDRSVFGKAVTHGCVRVPDKALRELTKVPLGTLVLITG